MTRFVLWMLASACALLALSSCSNAPAERGAIGVEATLLAPCCFNGTLDAHDSDLARTLRAEIEERVAQGEPTAAIQASMVERYGPKVLAMPNEQRFGAVLSVAALATLLVIGLTLLRIRGWLRAGRREEPSPPAPGGVVVKDAYDERIDAELERIDG
jgi:cytochrome c-type biogenesis protein CcmH